MKIKLNSAIEKVSILILFVIIFFMSIVPIGIRTVLIGTVFMLLIFNSLFNRKQYMFNFVHLSWLASLLVILFTNKNYAGTSSYILFFVVGYFSIIQCGVSDNLNVLIVKVINIMGKFFAVMTWIQFWFPTLYDRFILPSLIRTESDSIDMADKIYLAGLTNQVAINAIYILLGLVTLILFYEKNKKYNTIFWFVIEIIALLLTGKRMSIVFGIIAIIVGMISGMSFSKKIKRVLMYIGIVIMVGIISYIFVPSIRETFMRIFITAGNLNEYSSGRITLYKYAFSLFKRNPLWGNGWFSYGLIITNFWGSRIHTHNIYLQLLCETGIVGYLVFIISLFGSLLYTFKVLKNCNNPYHIRFVRFSIAIQVFYLIYGMTGNPIYDTYNLLLYFISLLIVCRIGWRKEI